MGYIKNQAHEAAKKMIVKEVYIMNSAPPL
jgi:hypothetical protein